MSGKLFGTVLKGVRNKKIAPVLIFFLSSLVAIGLVATEPELQSKPVKKILPVVKVKTVKPSRETLIVYSEGVLSPSAESTLVPEVDGRVVWVSPAFKAGGHFAAGDVLFRIDRADYQTDYENAQARLDKALAELEFSDSEFHRGNALNKKKLLSESKFDEVSRQFELSSAEARLARLALDQAQRNLDRTVIKAPYSGRVRSEKVEFGQFVRRGDVVAEIYADQMIKVRLPIPNRQMAFMTTLTQVPAQQDNLHQSQTANDSYLSVSGSAWSSLPLVNFSVEYAGKFHQWQGRLVRHEAELDSQSRMVYGIAEMTQEELPDGLPMGLFVKAEIEGRSVDDLVHLHRGAIRNGSEVVVVDQDNRLRVRPVTVLRHQGDETIVSSGLVNGDRVCVSPINIVVDGMQVEALEQEATPVEMVTEVISERKATLSHGDVL